MRKIYVHLISLALIAFCLLCQGFAQISVHHINRDSVRSGNDGLIYSLPQTFVKVDVVVEKTQNIKGPYAAYANKFLGLKNVIYSNSTIYNIKDIRISTYAEPDPDHFYSIEMNKPEKKSRKDDEVEVAILQLTQSGLIHSINECTGDFEEEDTYYFSDPGHDEIPDLFKYYADDNLFEQIDTLIEMVNYDTITVERQVLKKTMVEKSLEQRARVAADYILKIRDSRYNLLSGYQEVNYEEGALKYMHEQLEYIENEHIKLFSGISFSTDLFYSFSYLPDFKGEFHTDELFNFSDNFGIIGKEKPVGQKVLITINRRGYTRSVKDWLKRSNNDTENGLVYRIPEYSDVSIKYGGTERAKARLLINQLGAVVRVPAHMKSVIFYPERGSIKNIKVNE